MKKGNPKNKRKCTRCESYFAADKVMCPVCKHWNDAEQASDDTITLEETSDEATPRIKTGPWDICFGPPEDLGIATASVILLGGAPGAGKSTWALQLSDRIADVTQKEVLYIGTEESREQIKGRAKRLNIRNLQLIRLLPMGSTSDLGSVLMSRRPSAVILDSLPGMGISPDDAAEFCSRFKQYAVELNAPIIIIDHVTKDGDLAGFMDLQHAVDTTVTLFPVDDSGMREMETLKNRFGPAQVFAHFAMTATGLFHIPDNADEEDETDE